MKYITQKFNLSTLLANAGFQRLADSPFVAESGNIRLHNDCDATVFARYENNIDM